MEPGRGGQLALWSSEAEKRAPEVPRGALRWDVRPPRCGRHGAAPSRAIGARLRFGEALGCSHGHRGGVRTAIARVLARVDRGSYIQTQYLLRAKWIHCSAF